MDGETEIYRMIFNKLEVGFTIGIYHGARSRERQVCLFFLTFVEMEKKFPEISATESCAEMESFESRTKDL